MFKAIRQRIRDMRTLKTLCFGAEEHASRRGHREPGAEHFVLAAMDLRDNTAKQALAGLGITPDAFDAAIENQYRSALTSIGLAIEGAPGLEQGMSIPIASGPTGRNPRGRH